MKSRWDPRLVKLFKSPAGVGHEIQLVIYTFQVKQYITQVLVINTTLNFGIVNYSVQLGWVRRSDF